MSHTVSPDQNNLPPSLRGEIVSSASPGRVVTKYADLNPDERAASRAAFDRLLAVSTEHSRAGWQPWELDPIVGEARHLGVRLWPALIARIRRSDPYITNKED